MTPTSGANSVAFAGREAPAGVEGSEVRDRSEARWRHPAARLSLSTSGTGCRSCEVEVALVEQP
jgi:hypothetical protein